MRKIGVAATGIVLALLVFLPPGAGAFFGADAFMAFDFRRCIGIAGR